jgi:hypothetical protein
MKRLINLIETSALISAGLTLGLLINGSHARADVVRTGPNGNTTTTQRQVQDNTLMRTTTGPNGQSATTTTIVEDGTVTRTHTGPNGQSATSTHEVTVEQGQIVRESTGPRGNRWEVRRSR